MRIQYIHDHVIRLAEDFGTIPKEKNKRTFCFHLPEYEEIETELIKLLTIGGYESYFMMGVGVAKCHPKDNFSKAIGREVALDNNKEVLFKISRVIMDNNKVKMYVWNIEQNIACLMLVKRDTRTLRILDVE